MALRKSCGERSSPLCGNFTCLNLPICSCSDHEILCYIFSRRNLLESHKELFRAAEATRGECCYGYRERGVAIR